MNTMTQNSMSKKSERIKTLTTLAMIVALAYAAAVFLKVPVSFLTFEPKDAILCIGAFVFGPVAGVAMSVVVCFVEMITVSSTGPIGFVMNSLASCAFVGISSLIYCRKKTMTNAVLGLVAGSLTMTVLMLLWNYILTPLYMGVPQEAVLQLMLPLLVPFNLIKCALNSAICLFLYKPIVIALRKSHLIKESTGNVTKKKTTVITIVVSAVLMVSMIVVLVLLQGANA